MNPQEKIYNLMSRAGGIGIAAGIAMIVTGIAAGVLTIVAGAKLLLGRRGINL